MTEEIEAPDDWGAVESLFAAALKEFHAVAKQKGLTDTEYPEDYQPVAYARDNVLAAIHMAERGLDLDDLEDAAREAYANDESPEDVIAELFGDGE